MKITRSLTILKKITEDLIEDPITVDIAKKLTTTGFKENPITENSKDDSITD